MIIAILPVPPSANSLYIAKDRHRYISPVYKRWLREARVLMRCLDTFPAKTPLRVDIDVVLSRRRDLDNIIKPILDSMQPSKAWAGVIPDDRYVDVIEARRVPAGEISEGWCRVCVYTGEEK